MKLSWRTFTLDNNEYTFNKLLAFNIQFYVQKLLSQKNI